MASVGAPASSGGKRSLDAELNLVPFIDLLSMCICFLLMTAVWMQVASVQVKQSHGTEAAAAVSTSHEIDLRFTGPDSLRAQIKRAGKVVLSTEVRSEGGALAAALERSLPGWIQSLGGARKDLFSAAMITPSSGVSYGALVSVMDVLRKHQIANLGVVPAQGR